MFPDDGVVLPKAFPFRGQDFRIWSDLFQVYLRQQKLNRSYLNEPAPGEDISDDRREQNEDIWGILLMSMDGNPENHFVVACAQSTRFSTNPDEECGDAPLAWARLRDRWAPDTPATYYQKFFDHIYSMKDEPNKDPTVFIDEVETMARELAEMGRVIETDFIKEQILLNLPDMYGTDSVLLRHKTKTLESIRKDLKSQYMRLIHHGFIVPPTDHPLAEGRSFFTSNGRNNGGHQRGGNSNSSSSSSNSNGNNGTRRFKGKCHYCRKVGHRAVDCQELEAAQNEVHGRSGGLVL